MHTDVVTCSDEVILADRRWSFACAGHKREHPPRGLHRSKHSSQEAFTFSCLAGARPALLSFASSVSLTGRTCSEAEGGHERGHVGHIGHIGHIGARAVRVDLSWHLWHRLERCRGCGSCDARSRDRTRIGVHLRHARHHTHPSSHMPVVSPRPSSYTPVVIHASPHPSSSSHMPVVSPQPRHKRCSHRSASVKRVCEA